MIYLDYASNNPVDEEVLDEFYKVTKTYYANPNAIHTLGKESKALIEQTNQKIATLLEIKPEEIIYTSGASEANNLAIKGIAKRYRSHGKHILVSALEHNSIIASCTSLLEEGFDIEVIPVNRNGLVNIEELKKMIRKDTILVSICSVDSEIGIKQPIEEISLILNEYPQVHFHTDATHAIGKIFINYSNVDLITISPHKFYGMLGIGLLIKKETTDVRPLINGGKSTTIYRSGTPDTASIVAAGIALEKALKHQKERYEYVEKLHNLMMKKLEQYNCIHINSVKDSMPFTLNISVKNVKSIDFAKRLEEKGVIVSTKTACCPIETPSKLVYTLTRDKALANSSIRISLSHLTTEEEITKFLEIFDACLKEK